MHLRLPILASLANRILRWSLLQHRLQHHSHTQSITNHYSTTNSSNIFYCRIKSTYHCTIPFHSTNDHYFTNDCSTHSCTHSCTHCSTHCSTQSITNHYSTTNSSNIFYCRINSTTHCTTTFHSTNGHYCATATLAYGRTTDSTTIRSSANDYHPAHSESDKF